jgi:hypothetical protein
MPGNEGNLEVSPRAMSSIIKQCDVYRITECSHNTNIFVLYVGFVAVIKRSASTIVEEGRSGHVYIYPNHTATHLRFSDIWNVSVYEDKEAKWFQKMFGKSRNTPEWYGE